MESAATPGLAWKWILEKLVDLPDFGVTCFNEVITRHITDLEEPHCRPLLERVALGNLEEMVVTNQIDAGAIPLLKALTKQGPGSASGSSVMQRCNKELVLRIQTEVVISVLRKDVDEGEIDWAFYEAEMERVFGDAVEDNRLLDRKRELCALLKPKNQTKAIVASYFEKYALKKLRDDLSSFIEEKRKSFTTVFLNQLSRDFRDANGKPFVEDVEKSTNVEANGKQDHVGQTPNVNETEDQHIVLGTAITSGKKRLRRKLLSTQDDIRDDESDEAEEGSAGVKKPRNVSLTSIVKPLLPQGVLELAVPASGRRSGCFSMKQDVESRKQPSLLNRGEEPSSGLGNLVKRSCSPVVHESISMEVAKVSSREPSRSNKYVVILDVDSDAETQVVKTLSTDDEDSVTVEGDGDEHIKKRAQSLPENGSGLGHPQTIVEAEDVREETSIVLIEQKILVDRKEASTSPEVKVSQHEGHEKSVTKDFIHLDSQDTHEIDFLEVGRDGHEDACHICRDGGKLVCCDGCPISMHFNCIKGLGVTLSSRKQDWYCPVCSSLRAAREAAEAEKAAIVAKEKLKAFKMKSKNRDRFAEGDNSSPEKAGKQSRLRISSPKSGESDRALKSKQQSDDEPKQGQRNSDPSIESLGPAVVKKGLHHLRQKDSDRSLPPDEPQANRLDTLGKGVDGNSVERALPVNEQLVLTSPNLLVKSGKAGSIRDLSAKPRKTQLSHDQEVSRRDRFAASTSGQVKRERGRFARFKNKKGTEVDSDEESGEQARAGVPEPASGANGRRQTEGDEDDEELDEDPSEDGIQGALYSGRQRIPGFRRKPLPWTKKEEFALKEGVKRFSHNGSWGFQWKRILQFGQGRFDPSRTDVDLKDKWRNLVRGVS